MKFFYFFLILFLCSIPFAAGFKLTSMDLSKEVFFEPGLEFTQVYYLHGDQGTEIQIDIPPTYQDIIHIESTNMVLTGESQSVPVYFKFPLEWTKESPEKIVIKFRELPKPGQVYVSAYDAYVKILPIIQGKSYCLVYSENINKEDHRQIVVHGTNIGTEAAQSFFADVYINDLDNNNLFVKSTPVIQIQSKESGFTETFIDMSSLAEGQYIQEVEIFCDSDQPIRTDKGYFDIGKKAIKIQDVTLYFTPEISEMEITLKNFWNAELLIKNKIKIFDQDKNLALEFNMPLSRIQGFRELTHKEYVDFRGWESGKYSMEITLNYAGLVEKETFDLFISEEPAEESPVELQKEIPSNINNVLVPILVVCIIFIIGLFIVVVINKQY